MAKVVKAKNKEKQREFYVIIEQDEDGYYVGEVPQLEGCYTQGQTLDELMKNMKEVIQLCLAAEASEEEPVMHFVGVQKITV